MGTQTDRNTHHVMLTYTERQAANVSLNQVKQTDEHKHATGLQVQICKAQCSLQYCPGALTKCQNATWNRCDLRSLLNLLVSVVSLILSGREFQAAGPP